MCNICFMYYVSGQQKKLPKPLERYHDLKSLAYILKLPPISPPNSPPPIPPPPIPPPPINYSPSPPPPPIRAHIPLKLTQPPPPPPPRTDQPKVTFPNNPHWLHLIIICIGSHQETTAGRGRSYEGMLATLSEIYQTIND